MKNTKLVNLLLRLSISSVFLYAAVSATLDPGSWVGYIPQAFYVIAPVKFLLLGFSLFQGILAVWILAGWKSFFSSALAAITLLAIIVANWGDLNVLFRDFAIFFAALALAAGSFSFRSS